MTAACGCRRRLLPFCCCYGRRRFGLHRLGAHVSGGESVYRFKNAFHLHVELLGGGGKVKPPFPRHFPNVSSMLAFCRASSV
jgi:hypothetical protein